jgi:tRNA (guanine-N7-)-methyltransferase
MESEEYQRGTRKFYGRRKGKSLRQEQTNRLETLLPRYAVPDIKSLFGHTSVWLEIGFGGGEHLVHLAESHPETLIIGCEPFQNGVAKCLALLEDSPKDNLFIHAGDARDLLDVLPENFLERVYLLYPDPWPKLRHQKRRFISHENLTLLSRCMKVGAELRFATDIPHYVKTAVQHIEAHPDFRVKSAPNATPWEGWYRTRYEQKALREGRDPAYTIFEK